MKFSDLPAWVPIVGAILAAGLWLGSLAQRVTNLENQELYLHGHIAVPGAK